MDSFLFENYIAGRWQAPLKGLYLETYARVKGIGAGRVPRSTAEDVELALDAAAAAATRWARTAQDRRAKHLAAIEEYAGEQLLTLALADCWDRGAGAFIVDRRTTHGVLAALAGPLTRLLAENENPGSERSEKRASFPVIYKLALPAEVDFTAMCRRIVPFLLQGHPVVTLLLYQNAGTIPLSPLAFLGLMASHLPRGVLNLVTGVGLEAGLALERSPRAKFPAPAACAFAHASLARPDTREAHAVSE